jgi:hypothetical protein
MAASGCSGFLILGELGFAGWWLRNCQPNDREAYVAAAIQTPADGLKFLKQMVDFFRRCRRRKLLGFRGLRLFFWRPIAVALEQLEPFAWTDAGGADRAHV